MKIVQQGDEYIIEHSKNVSHRDLNTCTGTRFKKLTIQQYAFDTLLKCLQTGENYYPDLCKRFNSIKKKNGNSVNLDTSYLNLAISSHPDFFRIDLEKRVWVKRYPVTDDEEIKRKLRGRKMKEEAQKQEEKLKKRRGREETKAIGTFDTLDHKEKIDNEKEYVNK